MRGTAGWENYIWPHIKQEPDVSLIEDGDENMDSEDDGLRLLKERENVRGREKADQLR